MKQIGVDVTIQQVPPGRVLRRQGRGQLVPGRLLHRGLRYARIANNYFQFALTSTAPWNYSRWKNPEFDGSSKQIPIELDAAKRADLYKQAQQILQDQVPMMNFLVNTAVAGETSTIDGIALAPDWPQTLIREAHYTQ